VISLSKDRKGRVYYCYFCWILEGAMLIIKEEPLSTSRFGDDRGRTGRWMRAGKQRVHGRSMVFLGHLDGGFWNMMSTGVLPTRIDKPGWLIGGFKKSEKLLSEWYHSDQTAQVFFMIRVDITHPATQTTNLWPWRLPVPFLRPHFDDFCVFCRLHVDSMAGL
jgi:hypothetical protein